MTKVSEIEGENIYASYFFHNVVISQVSPETGQVVSIIVSDAGDAQNIIKLMEKIIADTKVVLEGLGEDNG